MVIAWSWMRATALAAALVAMYWPDSLVAGQDGPLNDPTIGSNDVCSNANPVDAAACIVYRQAYWSLRWSEELVDHERKLEVGGLVSEQLPINPTLSPSLAAENFPPSADLRRQYRIAVAFAAMDYVQTNLSTAFFWI